MYLILSELGLLCEGLSVVVVSGDYSLVAVLRLLILVASLVEEREILDPRASI